MMLILSRCSIVLAALILPGPWCRAGVPGGSSYARIAQRNSFHLNPRTYAQPLPSSQPRPKVHLTGITTIFPGKRALLQVEFPSKPPGKPKEEFYILAEGQAAGPIEVVAIDERKAQVTVNNSGSLTNITFEKMGPPLVGAAPLSKTQARTAIWGRTRR